MRQFCVRPKPRWCVRAFRRGAHTAGVFCALIALSAMQLGCALYNAELPPSGIDAPEHYVAAPKSKNGVAPAPDWW
jgi:hypothetical protein